MVPKNVNRIRYRVRKCFANNLNLFKNSTQFCGISSSLRPPNNPFRMFSFCLRFLKEHKNKNIRLHYRNNSSNLRRRLCHHHHIHTTVKSRLRLHNNRQKSCRIKDTSSKPSAYPPIKYPYTLPLPLQQPLLQLPKIMAIEMRYSIKNLR